jgi:hypothetical protein
MAGKSTALTVKILADAKPAARGFQQAERSVGGFSSKLGKLGGIAATGVAAVGAAAAAIGLKAFEAASALEQSTGAVESVFGKQAAAIKANAKNAADSVGLSANAYQELASVMGSQLKNMGTAQDQLAPKTDKLIGLGADLAATYGGTTADAVGALSSLLRGETDPIERYGVSIKQADVNARMAADGTDKLTGAQGKAARSAALMSLLTEQTGAAQGQAAREADTAAGSQQRLAAKFDNVMAILGEKLLPVFEKVVTFIEEKVLPVVMDLINGNGDLGKVFEQVGVFIEEQAIPAFKAIWEFIEKYVIPAFKNYLQPAIAGAKKAFEKITAAVERNREKFEPLFKFLRDKVAPFLGDVLGAAFEQVGENISFVIDFVGDLIEEIQSLIDWFGRAGDWVSGLFAGGTSTLEVTGGPQLAGAAVGVAAPLSGSIMGSSSGGGRGPAAAGRGDTYVNLTVNGALDPVSVARQVDGLLRQWATTSGRSPATLGWAR